MEKYQSNNYKKYTSKNPLMGIVTSNFTKNLQDIIVPLNNVKNAIDIGCGEGFIANCLSLPAVTGVDISRNALKIAKDRNQKYNFCMGSVYNLSFKRNSFDLVVATEVLEHLNEPEKALDEIRRVSKKYCILSVPNEPFFRTMNLLRGKNLKRYGNDIEHIQNWSSGEFVSLVDRYFEILEVRKPFPWTMVLCKIKE
jgi:ubiquinone/menaquinone biosynthesis C-methylase UbiE